MKVIEHLARAERPPISFEIIPPLRGGDIKGLLTLIDDLVQFRPPFIDITSHAARAEGEPGDDRQPAQARGGRVLVLAATGQVHGAEGAREAHHQGHQQAGDQP